MIVKLNGCIFLLKMMTYWENKMIFGITSWIVWKEDLIVNPSTIKELWKQKKPHGSEATYFYDKEIPKVGSNCRGVAVILIDFV